MRFDGRKFNELRKTTIERNYLKYPEGSVLISQGNTKIIVTASILESVPRFLVDKGTGWITAEYAMLPRATQTRNQRDTNRGRSQEIQRLIGRSLRAAFNYEKLGERTIRVDCDVIQADGGTRCAAITGAFVAVFDAMNYLYNQQLLYDFPDYKVLAAISLGIKKNQILLDLNYGEDSKVDVDLNLVMNENSEIIEVQGTAEGAPFSKNQLNEIIELGEKGVLELIQIQKKNIEYIVVLLLYIIQYYLMSFYS
ncbi:MAG: ribonuclease PH [Candidatus Lokiarchaeota archaeon]|nr:ribonuclease PH [Candidatus Lokiarchaeota archaeon]